MRKRKALELLNCSIHEIDEMQRAAEILGHACESLEKERNAAQVIADDYRLERDALAAKLAAADTLVDNALNAGRELAEQRDGVQRAFWALLTAHRRLATKHLFTRKALARLEETHVRVVAAADKDALRASHPPLEGVFYFTNPADNDLRYRMTVEDGKLVEMVYLDEQVWCTLKLDADSVVPSAVWAAYQEGWRDGVGSTVLPGAAAFGDSITGRLRIKELAEELPW